MPNDARNKAIHAKKGDKDVPAWKRKDFHKDTRDSFMKKLDKHKEERRKYF